MTTGYRNVVAGLDRFCFLKQHYEAWKRGNDQRTTIIGSRRIDTMPRQVPLPMWLYEAGWRS